MKFSVISVISGISDDSGESNWPCWKSTIETLENDNDNDIWRHSGVFIVNSKHIS